MEMSRKNADQHHQNESQSHGPEGGENAPKKGRDQSSGQGGAGIDVLDENIGSVSGQNIPKDTAANAGDDPHEGHEKQTIVPGEGEGGPDADDGENTQSQSVHGKQQPVIGLMVAMEQLPDKGKEDNDGGNQGCCGIDGILKGGRRGDAQHQIPDDTAAYSGHKSQNHNTENIHVLFDAGHGSGNGKGNGAYELED